MDGKGGTILMSFSFLFLGPFIAGLITVSQLWILAPWDRRPLDTDPRQHHPRSQRSVGRPDLCCLHRASPIALVASSIGGVIGGTSSAYEQALIESRTDLRCVACSAFPLLFAVLETHLNQPLQIRSVNTEIRIHAPASLVWQNIGRVPPISRSELRLSWANMIGFPRPIEATLSFEGVGGVRHASFERGLMFIETVTAWEPEHRLAFSIRADTAHIPTTTLDEHVTIGGRYFDVLDGEYRLEPLANGDTLLHLTSHQRLSTDFNAYAGLWTDAVMQNLQTSILEVIQHRCEQQTSSKLLH